MILPLHPRLVLHGDVAALQGATALALPAWIAVIGGRTSTAANPAARCAGHGARDGHDIGASLNGDGEAFARLVERHQSAVARQMYRFSRDRAVLEELVQDVFVEVFRSLHTWRGDAPFVHWLRRVATRTGYRHWKHLARRRSEAVPVEEVAAQLGTDGKELDPVDAGDQVHTLLARLRPRDRLVLTLMYLEGCSVIEIAQATGWSRAMVKVQAHRARKRLAALLEGSP